MSSARVPLFLAACLALAFAGPVPAGAPGEKAPPTRHGGEGSHTDRYGDPLPRGALRRLGTVRFRPNQAVEYLAFSPDGKTLASLLLASPPQVVLWDVATGKRLAEFKS